jgi:hypothetical protein
MKGAAMAPTPREPGAAHSELAPHPSASHDERVHLAAIHDTLYDGEMVHRLYRGHRGGIDLLAVTSQRIIMMERTAWDGHLALTSVPFSRVTAVSLLAQGDLDIDQATTVGLRVTSLSFLLHCADADEAREAYDLINWPLYH